MARSFETPNVGVDAEYSFYALGRIRKGEELTADDSTYTAWKSQRISNLDASDPAGGTIIE